MVVVVVVRVASVEMQADHQADYMEVAVASV